MLKVAFIVKIITTIVIFSSAFLVTNVYAAHQHIIKAVYFVPKNRPAQKHIPNTLSEQIKQTQRFYADQMEMHGYGRMTFGYEKDANNNPVIHQVMGKFDDVYYHTNTINKVEAEISQRFNDIDDNIYIISIDVSNGLIGGYCGKARYEGGPVFIPSNGNCVREEDVINLIAHELGHALNLRHDFRDVKYIMARGGPQRTQFSECSAMLLSVSHFLSIDHTHENAKGQIEMLSSDTYIINHRQHKLKFKVSDPDRVTQVFLEYVIPDTLAGIADCKSISNKLTEEIIFDMPDDAIKSQKTNIWIHIVDKNGHLTTEEYELTGTEKKDLSFTYLTLEYDNPNALTPINPQIDWGWDWGGWKHFWEKKPNEPIPDQPHQGFANAHNIRFINQWDHWFYAHAEGQFVYDLTLIEKEHRTFDAYFYLPNPCGNIASVEMVCKADNIEVFRSGMIRWAQAQNKHIRFNIPENTKEFVIEMDDAGDDGVCDHYIIANARLMTIEPNEPDEEKETDETDKEEPKSINAKSKLVLTWGKIKNRY